MPYAHIIIFFTPAFLFFGEFYQQFLQIINRQKVKFVRFLKVESKIHQNNLLGVKYVKNKKLKVGN